MAVLLAHHMEYFFPLWLIPAGLHIYSSPCRMRASVCYCQNFPQHLSTVHRQHSRVGQTLQVSLPFSHLCPCLLCMLSVAFCFRLEPWNEQDPKRDMRRSSGGTRGGGQLQCCSGNQLFWLRATVVPFWHRGLLCCKMGSPDAFSPI